MRLVSLGLVLFALTSIACSGTDGPGLPPTTETPPEPGQPVTNQHSPNEPPSSTSGGGGGGGGAGTGKPLAIALTTSTTTVTSSAPFLLDIAITDPDNVGLKEVVFRKKGVAFATTNGAPWSATPKLVN